MSNDKMYPNTGDGALSFLKENTDIDLSGAIVSPDHRLSGVWLVEHRNDKMSDMSVVYLKNHKDYNGKIRECNYYKSV